MGNLDITADFHGQFNPVIRDIGTVFVGAENDFSGACGDSGRVNATYTNAALNFQADIVCAHFVASSGWCNAGSPKTRFAYLDPNIAQYAVVRITDNGTPATSSYASGTTSSLLDAITWVNKGPNGAGHPSSDWTFLTPEGGSMSIKP
jgi:hypothetical protein